ncbi:MAG: hypothetical protein Q9170_002877 [Blastenia crenularia]
MSPSSAGRATSGIRADFFVDRVRRHESERGAYFAFQLNRPWLFDGLNALLNTATASAAEALDPADIQTRASALYGLIGSQLPLLPTALNATRDELASDSDDAVEAIFSPTFPDVRAEQVRDMLSVFDPTSLPDEFGQRFTTVPPDGLPQNFYVAENLAATIYHLAVRDETVFKRLRRVITHDVCATVHFSKLRARAREAFGKLDNYVENGPSPSNNQDIPRTARVLRSVVDQISQARSLRTSNDILNLDVITKVPEMLTEIFQEVCNRNEDVYYRIDWDRGVRDDEPARNRNLYAYLIDDPPRFSSSSPRWMQETFVIDRLRQIPANEWRHLIEILTNMLDQIREYTPDEDHPPLAYTKLESMIQEYTAEAFEPSSSSVQRRPTLGDQRESQRRRFE